MTNCFIVCRELTNNYYNPDVNYINVTHKRFSYPDTCYLSFSLRCLMWVNLYLIFACVTKNSKRISLIAVHQATNITCRVHSGYSAILRRCKLWRLRRVEWSWGTSSTVTHELTGERCGICTNIGFLKGFDDGIWHCEPLVSWTLSIVFIVNKI
jgi:hypothetical protein